MYFDKPVTFPFGHGLSYTSFAYANLHTSPGPGPGSPDAAMTASIDITNTGSRDGDEVVQLYARKPDSTVSRPIKQLIAFQRITIPKGATRTVHFTIPARSLSYWDVENHAFTVEPGRYDIMAGASSEDIRLRASVDLK
jgi:beta-glucosidase